MLALLHFLFNSTKIIVSLTPLAVADKLTAFPIPEIMFVVVTPQPFELKQEREISKIKTNAFMRFICAEQLTKVIGKAHSMAAWCVHSEPDPKLAKAKSTPARTVASGGVGSSVSAAVPAPAPATPASADVESCGCTCSPLSTCQRRCSCRDAKPTAKCKNCNARCTNGGGASS